MSQQNSNADSNMIIGTRTADTITGVDGRNDVLAGGGGGDVYQFGHGSGHDLIDENYRSFGSDGDVIQLDSNVNPTYMVLARTSRDLIIYLYNPSDTSQYDTLTVANYYVSDSAKIERIQLGSIVWNEDHFANAYWYPLPPVLETNENMIAGEPGDADELLVGKDDMHDEFESVGGNDELRGLLGNDTYWLGRGCGTDTIQEHYDRDGNLRDIYGIGDAGDMIKIKSDIDGKPAKVNLRRSSDGNDLVVELMPSSGNVVDQLIVEDFYTNDAAKVERIELMSAAADEPEWNVDYLAKVAIKGTGEELNLRGLDGMNDIFDSVAGAHTLQGFGGDDVYLLGLDTGKDRIKEGVDSIGGDDGDTIRIKSDIAVADVHLSRSGNHLIVQLGEGESENSLTVENYYSDDAAKIEFIKFSDGMHGAVGTVWDEKDILLAAAIKGGPGDDTLEGHPDSDDIFNSIGGGDDKLRGLSGNDEYWLRDGTDDDIIQEYYDKDGEGITERTVGDSADAIKVQVDAGFTVRLRRGELKFEGRNAFFPPTVTQSVRSERIPLPPPSPLCMQSHNLIIELLNADGMVTDSLTVEDYYVKDSAKIERVETVPTDKDEPIKFWEADDLAKVGIRRYPGIGGVVDLKGLEGVDDVFDSVGENDRLRGLSGNDVYWLGIGTGEDTIQEYYDKDGKERTAGDSADVIRIKKGLSDSHTVHLLRSENNLIVEVKENGVRISSLTIEKFQDASARIERVEFMDGTVWNEAYLDAKFEGRELQEGNIGTNGNDAFDNDDDTNADLRGKGGNDVYWLGYGTGHDRIHEYDRNRRGNHDPNDVIRIKSEIADITNVRLSLQGNNEWDLKIEITDSSGNTTDSLTVMCQYDIAGAKVERIEAAGHVLLESQFTKLIHELANFTAGESDFADEKAIYTAHWDDASTLAPSNG